MTVIDFETARRNMVEYQIRCCKVLDPIVLETLESMPREEFPPQHVRSLAYMEGRVPLPCGQEMLSPLQEASILQELELKGGERILEIGTGTGFLTAMIAMHAGKVVTFELHDELAELAQNNLEKHGIGNAKIICANAMSPEKLKGAAPFDAIVLGAALKEIPEFIRALVKEGGRLIAFVGHNPVVSLVRMDRIGSAWRRTDLFETLLQDMEGLPETRQFVF